MQAVTKQKMVAITWLARSRRIGKAGRNGVAPLLPVVRMGNRRRRVIASGPAGRRDFVAVGVRGQLDQILAIQSQAAKDWVRDVRQRSRRGRFVLVGLNEEKK